MADDLIDVWELPRGADRSDLDEASLGEPHLRARIVSSAHRTLTIQPLDRVPSPGSDVILYVRGRGAFEIILRERTGRGRGPPRVLLTLAPRPRR